MSVRMISDKALARFEVIHDLDRQSPDAESVFSAAVMRMPADDQARIAKAWEVR